MSTGLGVGASWHTGEPQTEAAVFERIQLKPGEETIACGALLIDGKLCFPSRASKEIEGELEIFCLDQSGTARILKARKDCAEIFAAALSLAW